MKTLSINTRFENYFEALDYGQEQQLEKSLKADLTSEPVMWWHNPNSGQDELLDGHNRYKIAVRCKLELAMHEKHFDTLGEAERFIIRTQTTRRNLDKYRREQLVKRAVELEISGGKTKTEAVQDVAEEMGISERQAWEDVKPSNPVEAFKKAKQTLENRLTVAKTKAADKLRSQAVKEQWDEFQAENEWGKVEDEITKQFDDDLAELESLGQMAAQAVEDNPGLKNTGKRTTKKSTKDKAARRNTFKKALSLIGKLRNEALYFWDQNGCGSVDIKPVQEALKVFVGQIEVEQLADAKAAKKRKFGGK